MVNYSLRPGSMKGELFKILLEQGNNGLKVSELVKSLQVIYLKFDLFPWKWKSFVHIFTHHVFHPLVLIVFHLCW